MNPVVNMNVTSFMVSCIRHVENVLISFDSNHNRTIQMKNFMNFLDISLIDFFLHLTSGQIRNCRVT